MEFEYLPCPTCRRMTLVEIPPCADEHGRDCPDRACTVCGAGLSVRGPAAFGMIVTLPPTIMAPTIMPPTIMPPGATAATAGRPQTAAHTAAAHTTAA